MNPLRTGRKSILFGLISPKKPKEWKLLAFIVFLFSLIVVGLTLIYHFHEESFYYIYQGSGFVVNEKSLEVKFKDASGNTVLVGSLWKDRPAKRLPFDCSDVDLKGQGLCLLWQHKARLDVLTSAVNNVTCHHVTWMSLSPDVEHCDCFELEDNRWFGGGINIAADEWPLERGSFDKRPFVSGDIIDHPRGFGPVLERLWLSSKGVALLMRHPIPMQLSLNSFDSLLNRTDGHLCIHSGDHLRPTQTTGGRNLSYSVCVADDIRQARSVALTQSLGGHVTRNAPPPNRLFETPVWSTSSYLRDRYNQSQVEDFAAEVSAGGIGGGVVMMDSGWEGVGGDATFDASRFPRPEHLVESLHQRGLLVSLAAHALVGITSAAFQQAADNGYLVRDQSGLVPGLVPPSRRGGVVSGVIDVGTNGVEWLRRKLIDVKSKYNVDSFHFEGGEVLSLPMNPTLSAPLTDPNDYTKTAAEAFSSFAETLLCVRSAYRAQNLSLVIRLTAGSSTWNDTGGLATVIPTVITMGLMGYPFFIPTEVGGGGGGQDDEMPSKELYTRWLQLSSFLPVMHLSIPPSYFDDETVQLAERLMTIRRQFVLPETLRVLGVAADRLTPLVRPIWWDCPTDREALGSANEFLVGRAILVAPVTAEGERERDVYLPEGVWVDVDHGDAVHRGPKWLRAYPAPLNEVPYFVRR